MLAGEQFPTFRGPSEFDKGMNRMHVGAIDNPDRAGRSNTTGEVDAVAGPAGLSPVPQRRRITARLRAQVIEHYNRGMSSRRVAATLGLGRTTVMEILKVAGVEVRPHGRRY